MTEIFILWYVISVCFVLLTHDHGEEKSNILDSINLDDTKPSHLVALELSYSDFQSTLCRGKGDWKEWETFTLQRKYIP